jgi:hypothetical protein
MFLDFFHFFLTDRDSGTCSGSLYRFTPRTLAAFGTRTNTEGVAGIGDQVVDGHCVARLVRWSLGLSARFQVPELQTLSIEKCTRNWHCTKYSYPSIGPYESSQRGLSHTYETVVSEMYSVTTFLGTPLAPAHDSSAADPTLNSAVLATTSPWRLTT